MYVIWTANLGFLHVIGTTYTSKHLLFYDGDGKSQSKFYIPTNGDKEHQENVTYIKDYLKKTSGVQYEENGKRPL